MGFVETFTVSMDSSLRYLVPLCHKIHDIRHAISLNLRLGGVDAPSQPSPNALCTPKGLAKLHASVSPARTEKEINGGGTLLAS